MKKKILIFSTKYDISTRKVMEWINFCGHTPFRVNGNDFYKKNNIFSHSTSNDSNIKIEINGKKIIKDDIYSIWFRKGSFPNHNKTLSKIQDKYLKKITQSYLSNELRAAKQSIFYVFKNKIILGSRILNPPLKIEMLLIAKEIGLNIPDTIVTNSKKELISFFAKHKKIISKPIDEVTIFSQKKDINKPSKAAIYSEIVDENKLSKITDYFFPSLFQEAIEKDIEIRTFFLDDKFYSMAIFSQLDVQTDVDYRMYNLEKSNRNVPYKLPENIEFKICKLMSKLKLKSGSIDLIKTKNNQYYFLEINVWGQYGMTSNPCNYSLDKKIAEYLINNETERKI